jgi:hypothetical protein
MEVTEEERQMLEVVRDHEADATSDFRLLVQKHGKGFAVVASEVKTLANHTSRATDEIARNLKRVHASASKRSTVHFILCKSNCLCFTLSGHTSALPCAFKSWWGPG